MISLLGPRVFYLMKIFADKRNGLSLIVIHWPEQFLEDLFGFSDKLKSWLFHFSKDVSAKLGRLPALVCFLAQ